MSYSRYNQGSDRTSASSTWEQNAHVPGDPVTSQPRAVKLSRRRLPDEPNSSEGRQKYNYETVEIVDYKNSTARPPLGVRSSSRHSTFSGLSRNYAVDNRTQQSYTEFNSNQNSIFHHESEADDIGDNNMENEFAKDKKRTTTGIGCCQKSTSDTLETENQRLKEELAVRETQVTSLTKRNQDLVEEFKEDQQRYEELITFIRRNRNPDMFTRDDDRLEQTERNAHCKSFFGSNKHRTDKLPCTKCKVRCGRSQDGHTRRKTACVCCSNFSAVCSK